MAFLASGLSIWNGFFRSKVSYYRDFVLEGGVPKGIYGLSSNEVSHRNNSWKFVTRAGKVRKMTLVNSYGKLNPDATTENNFSLFGALDMNILYDSEGRINEIEEYDDRGNLTKVDFYDAGNRLTVIDVIGAPLKNRNTGYASLACRYDKKDRLTEMSWYDETGNRCRTDELSCALLRLRCDKTDILETAYFDERERPCRVDGVAKTAYKYKKGNLVEIRNSGVDGKLCLSQTDRVAVTKYTYDDDNRLVRESYYGPEKKPFIYNRIIAKSGFINREHLFGGYAKSRCRYDASGNLLEQSYYGTDGSLCLYDQYFRYNGYWTRLKSGYAIVRHTYDSENNLIKTAYFGTDGRPCRYFEYEAGFDTVLCSLEYAEVRYAYDSRGNRINESYYDVNGEPYPCFSKRDGLLSVETRGGYVKIIHTYI